MLGAGTDATNLQPVILTVFGCVDQQAQRKHQGIILQTYPCQHRDDTKRLNDSMVRNNDSGGYRKITNKSEYLLGSE